MFDFNFILLLLTNGLISLSFFIFVLVYFFTEARRATREVGRRALLFSSLICGAGIANALMMRFSIQFPQIGEYDLNSTHYLVTNLISAMMSLFTYALYLRVGQQLSHTSGMPGSALLGRKEDSRGLNWKLLLTPIPFLIIWTFFWFGFIPPEPTDLALASSPEGDSLMVYLYTFFTASILAPITEEILYRHFAMALLARWFGSSKTAIILNLFISSLVFAIAHAGVVTADWIKIVQILPMGIVFGWVNMKKGVEHSILSHSLFNTLVIPISLLMETVIGI